jgi:uncharacterized membrane protein YccC
MSGRALLQSLRSQLPDLLETVKSVVPLLKAAAYRAQDGTLQVPLDMPQVEALEQSVLRHGRRWEAAIVGAAIILGGLIWLAVGRAPQWPGWVMLIAGGASILKARLS